MKLVSTIENVMKKLAPGRLPSFLEAHVIMAIETLIDEGTIGRQRLAETLNLGGGVTRTLIKHLREDDLIEVSRSGIALSVFGQKIASELRTYLTKEIEVPKGPLTVGSSNLAILVKNKADLVGNGVKLRDAAMKAGALGATTLIFRDNKLILPGMIKEHIEQNRPITEFLIENLQPAENDAIIIGSAHDHQNARIGAKMAAFSLLVPECHG